jgi:hypothetical protein
MCSESRPCWGTPHDIKQLINKGFANLLMCDYYDGDLNGTEIECTEIITPALVGYEGKYAPFWPMGKCTFYTEKGLCSIHHLKPIEGRVCDHRYDEKVKYVHASIVHLWMTDEGKQVVELWQKLTSE